MKQSFEELKETIIALEQHLIDYGVRHDVAQLEAHITDDFLEFPSDGIPFGKAEALADVPSEVPTRFHQQDFQLRMLADDVAMLTYRATIRRPTDAPPKYSLRCSIWKHNGKRWQMTFHQGTLCPAFEEV